MVVRVLPDAYAEEIVTVDSVRKGRGIHLYLKEYLNFLSSINIDSDFAARLKPGEKLKLKGKKGLGGFLVLEYEKY